MKHIIESIIGRRGGRAKPGNLYKSLEKSFSRNLETFIISMDLEDNLHLELSEEYDLSELILKRDDSQKKVFHTSHMVIELVSIQVKPLLRNRGIASHVLRELTLWADDNNVVIVGDPDDMFNTPLDVLYKLYGKFGFEQSEKYNPIPNAWEAYHKIVRFPRRTT